MPLKLVLVRLLVIQFDFPVRVRTLAEVLGDGVETTIPLRLFNEFHAVSEEFQLALHGTTILRIDKVNDILTGLGALEQNEIAHPHDDP